MLYSFIQVYCIVGVNTAEYGHEKQATETFSPSLFVDQDEAALSPKRDPQAIATSTGSRLNTESPTLLIQSRRSKCTDIRYPTIDNDQRPTA
jgi:hypothetical protein